MPPVIQAVVRAVNPIVGLIVSPFVFIGTTIANLGLDLVSRAIQPKPKHSSPGTLSQEARGRTLILRASDEPHRTIYGTAVVSGPLVFAATTTQEPVNANEYLNLVIALAGHQVEAIPTVWLNDLPSTDARFAGLILVKKILGREDQPVDADLVAQVPTPWTSSHRLRGIAYLYIRLKWDANVWVNGIPNIKAEVQGKRLWDPRSGSASVTSSSVANPTVITTGAAHGLALGDRVFITGHAGSVPNIDGEYLVLSVPSPTTFTIDVNVTTGGTGGSAYKMLWSNNAALCQLDYLVSRMGIEADSVEIHQAAWMAAANVCDELVALAAGGTQKRYVCDGVFSRAERPIDVMEKLLTASAGTVVYQQGTYRGYAGAFATPTVTLDRDDLRGNIELHSKPSRRDLFNAVRGTFVDADNFYQPADFTPVTNATYQAQDNGLRLYQDIELPFTTNNFRAQRIAKIYLERSRRSIMVKFPANLRALELAAWDTVQVTIGQLGWTAKVFRILEWSFAEDGGIDLMLQEEDANVYVWSAEETALPAAPATTLPNPFSVPAPSGLALASGTATQLISADGTVHSRIKVTWTAPTDQFLVSGGRAEIQFKKNADSIWISGPRPLANDAEAYIAPVDAGISYDVRVRFVNNAGAAGAYTTSSGHSVGADTTAPAVPTSVTVTPGFQLNIIRWTNPADDDLDVIEIWRSTTNNSATATKVGEKRGTEFVDEKLANATQYFYWLKARDTTGNASAFHAGATSGVSGTTLRVTTPDVGDDQITNDAIFSSDSATNFTANGDTEIGTVTITTDGGEVVVFAECSLQGVNNVDPTFKIKKGAGGSAIGQQVVRHTANGFEGVFFIGRDISPGTSQTYQWTVDTGNVQITLDNRRLLALNLKK